jgi:hypothetical protein
MQMCCISQSFSHSSTQLQMCNVLHQSVSPGSTRDADMHACSRSHRSMRSMRFPSLAAGQRVCVCVYIYGSIQIVSTNFLASFRGMRGQTHAKCAGPPPAARPESKTTMTTEGVIKLLVHLFTRTRTVSSCSGVLAVVPPSRLLPPAIVSSF